MPYERVGKCVYKKLSNGKLSKKPVGCSDSIPKAKAYLKTLYSVEEVNETLSPEVNADARTIFKSTINKNADNLLKTYKSGIKAEQIAMWTAIKNAKNKAKNQTEEPEEKMEDGKLKEMVKAALKTPISKKNKDIDESREAANAISKLEPILRDILKATQQVDSSQDDTEDDVEELDKSIDYLSAAITGRDPLLINVDQDILGRLAKPTNEEVYEWKRDLDEDLDGEDTLFSRASNVLNSYSGKVTGIGEYIEYLSSFNNKGEEYLQDAIREVIKSIGYSDIEEELKIKLERLIPLFDKQGKYIREDLDIDNIDEDIDSKILAHLKSEKDPTDESKPFDIDKLVNVKKTDRGNYEVYYLTNSGKKEGILVYQYEIDKMKKKNIDENSLLKEYTDQNFSGKELIGGLRYPDMFGMELFKNLFPNSVKNEANAIRSLNAFDKLQYPPNVFVHVGYNEFDADIDGANEKFQIHQSVYYNHNYDDERSPDVVKLSLYKKLGDGKEEEIGQILTKSGEASKDLKNLDITKRVSEGTCGYAPEGKIDVKNTNKLTPAGPHLLKKKIKEIIQNKIKNMNENKPSSGLSKKQKPSVAKKELNENKYDINDPNSPLSILNDNDQDVAILNNMTKKYGLDVVLMWLSSGEYGDILYESSTDPVDEDKDWIQKAIKRPGALHKELGIKPGEKIPKSKINKAISKLKKKDKNKEKEGTQLGAADERELKQLTLAKTLSKFNENKLAETIFAKLRK